MNNEYKKYVKDIFKHDDLKKMKKYIQHGNASCSKHCIMVSYISYSFCKKLNNKYNFNLDLKAISRAGLLHDFFLYDWHDKGFKLTNWLHFTKLQNKTKESTNFQVW